MVPNAEIELPEIDGRLANSKLVESAAQSKLNYSDKFHRSGCFLFRNAFDPNDINRLKTFAKGFLSDSNILQLSEKNDLQGTRNFFPVGLAGGVVGPSIYANKFILPVVSEVLENDFLVSRVDLLDSPPGNEKTSCHSDHVSLFWDHLAPDIIGKVPSANL